MRRRAPRGDEPTTIIVALSASATSSSPCAAELDPTTRYSACAPRPSRKRRAWSRTSSACPRMYATHSASTRPTPIGFSSG
jgi:hypothetical protein